MMAKKRKTRSLSYVVVDNKGYGNRLKGQKIYYEGVKPKGLRDDGAFRFGKNILELLQDKFGKKFKIVLTKDTDAVSKDKQIHVVQISAKTLAKINSELLNRTRDIKLSIMDKQFSKTHPRLASKSIAE